MEKIKEIISKYGLISIKEIDTNGESIPELAFQEYGEYKYNEGYQKGIEVGKSLLLLKDKEAIRQQILEEVIGGKIDIVKLIEHARCPHPDCDNKGTIAERISEDEWEPSPCQWCNERKQILSNLGALKDKN